MDIKLAGVSKDSIVDGEGIRYAIFVQGCEHNCPGCQNPNTHDYDNGGVYVPVEDLLNDIVLNPIIRGITLTGGDPLYYRNIDQVTQLCKKYKTLYPKKTIWIYTGYKFEDYKNIEVMQYIDVLVDGRYIESLRDLSLKYRGSSNQRVIDVKESLANDMIVLYCD